MRNSGSHRRVARALESTIRSLNIFENLERRQHLHAGHVGEEVVITPDQVDAFLATPNAGHVPASTFVQAHPEFAGLDLWDPMLFNPLDSTNPADWLYDPHRIENDLNTIEFPAVNEAGPEVAALPDLVPIASGVNAVIDTTEVPGHTLLRFRTTIGNQGAGPAILSSNNTGTPPAGSGITSWVNADGTQNVLQQLYSFNGTNFTFDSYRPAGRMTYHASHGHFHLEGYASYRLLTNVGGNPGPVAVRSGFDGSEATGDKVGFCLVNISNTFTLPGTSTSSSTLPGFSAGVPPQSSTGSTANGQPNTSCGFRQGIHVGKADVYDAIYDGQWVDITGVPTGNYFLEVRLDAQDVILEQNETNNTMFVPVTINTSNAPGGIQPDRFEPNNSFAEATDLGVLGVETQPGLTAHISSESDYFRFVAASTGTYTVQLTIADRDMNLSVYDNAFTLIGQSTSPLSGSSGFPVGESVTVNFVAGQTYYAKAQAFGSDLSPTTSAVSSNYAFKVNVNPTVNASTPDDSAAEQGLTSGSIAIARNGPTSSPLSVNISVSGSATRGVDYDLYADNVLIAGNTISIGNEAPQTVLEVRPISDASIEAAETVSVTVGNSAAYVVGGLNAGTVTIQDTPPAVTAQGYLFETLNVGPSFTFSLDVSASLDLDDIAVTNLTTNTPVTLAAVSYNAGLNRGLFGFSGIPADGNYQAVLSARGVTHALGASLAEDSVLDFFVFAGDANRDRSVNIDDFGILASNFNTAGTFSQGDFDYSGGVDIDDFGLLASKFNTSLPAARAASSAPSTGDQQVGALPPRSPFASNGSLVRIYDEIDSLTGLPA